MYWAEDTPQELLPDFTHDSLLTEVCTNLHWLVCESCVVCPPPPNPPPREWESDVTKLNTTPNWALVAARSHHCVSVHVCSHHHMRDCSLNLRIKVVFFHSIVLHCGRDEHFLSTNRYFVTDWTGVFFVVAVTKALQWNSCVDCCHDASAVRNWDLQRFRSRGVFTWSLGRIKQVRSKTKPQGAEEM